MRSPTTLFPALAVLFGCACVQTPTRTADSIMDVSAGPLASELEVPVEPGSLRPRPGFPLAWYPGQALLQGFGGASYLSDFTVSANGSTVELDDDEYEVLPVLGGGAQLKLAGQALDFGLEGFLSFSGRTDLEAFASGGGGAVAVFDVSLLVVDVYGGPFLSCFLSDRLRVYGSAGPLLEWAGYEQSDDTEDEDGDDDTSGFGGGFYARTGIEFLLPSGKLVGFGARWSDSSIELGDDFGDLDLQGLELFVSYSYGLAPRSEFDDL